MPKLTLSFYGQTVSEHPLDRERTTIGRKPDNDIQIDNLAVSGYHASVLTILDDSFLEDLRSTNGTYVNGERIRRHALRDGDVITIGEHTLIYSADTDATVSPASLKTPAARADESPSVSAPETEGPAASRREKAPAAVETATKAWVRVLNGARAGHEVELTKATTTLGKPGVQVAAITRRPDGYYVVAVETGDGGAPSVDDRALDREGVRLDSGSVLEVAGVRMEFLLE